MGRENYYKPGSFYRVCDQSGFVTRAERTRKQWNNLIVRDQSFENRNAQDFVKGVQDNQTVPEARPKPPTYTFVGPAQSTLSAAANTGATTVSVNSPFSASIGNQLAITLNADLGTIFLCRVTGGGPSGGAVSFTPPLPGAASSGNAIANLSVGNVSAASYGASNGG